MEIDNIKESSDKSASVSGDSDLIQVRAIISCEHCGYKKKFRNQFPRSQMELLVVATKIFEWLVCDKCGDLLKLDLEFQV
jgi:DNA-directed RNA polymerase subunit RPC12/RpoP